MITATAIQRNSLKGETVSTLGDEVVVKIKKIILHEKYNKDTFDYDIALLRLEEPVTLSRLIRPICIPKNNNNYKPGAKCIVAGWGFNKERRGSLPNLLNAVEVCMILFLSGLMKGKISVIVRTYKECAVNLTSYLFARTSLGDESSAVSFVQIF